MTAGAASASSTSTDSSTPTSSSPGAALSPSSSLLLPLLAREAFAATVHTSALTRQGLGELEAAVLRLAGAPQVCGSRSKHRCLMHMLPYTIGYGILHPV